MFDNGSLSYSWNFFQKPTWPPCQITSATVIKSGTMTLPASVTDNEKAVTRFLTAYYRDFSSLDIHSISPYFNESCLIIGAQGVVAAQTRSVLASVFSVPPR